MDNRGSILPGYRAGASRAEMAAIPASSFWTEILRERASALTAVRTSPPASSVHAWEEEVASLNTILALANRQRNAYSRSCSLPPELLSRIFEELIAISPIDTDAEDRVLRCGWIAVIHICQHWRNVAMTNSSLWKNITFLSAPLWDLFVACARDKPLTVSGNISAKLKSFEDFFDLIPAHIDRFKELHLLIEPSTGFTNRLAQTHFAFLLKKLNSSRESLNLLEVLSLKPSGSVGGLGVSVDFIKHCPVLRRLTLQFLSLPSNINPPSLTSLELINTTHLSVNVLLETLANLPFLDDLTLDRIDIVTASIVQPPVKLAHVRRLVIKDSLVICAVLLKSVTTHPLVYTEIDASQTDHLHDDDLSELGHILLSSEEFEPTVLELTAYEGRTICTVVAYCGEDEAGLYGPFNSNHPIPSDPHPWPGIKATLPVPASPLESPCALAPIVMLHFLSRTPKESWEDITFKGHMHWDSELVLETFSDAIALGTLAVDNVPADSVSAFCKALVASPATSLDPESTFFPELHALYFSSINFGCPADECDGEQSAVHYLTDVLIDKCRMGKPLIVVTLHECSVDDYYVDEWSSYVEVDWDGESGSAHEHHTDSEGDEEGDGDDDDGQEEIGV